MELIFLGENFEPVSAPIDKYYSFKWTEKYYGSGEFTLHLSPEYLPTVLRAAYIYNNDADEAMLIERVEAHDADSKTLEIGGMSLDGIFKWRVMDSADTYAGRVEDIARQAVQKYAMSGERAFPLLKLGRDTNIPDTISTGSKVGATLYDWLHDTLKPFEISWRLHYNYEANELLFEVYKGLDRTQDQDANTWAIFSTSFENLTSFTYQRNAIDYRNYAIVKKRDSGTIVTVDKTNGGVRREMYIEVDDDASVSQMQQAGEESLAEYQLVETIDGEIQPGANLVYGRDYSLGDLCNLEGAELGISASARLTQMTTVVENGVVRRIPAFGEQYLSLRQYIARAAGSGGGTVVATGGGGGGNAPAVDLTQVWEAISANANEIQSNASQIEATQAAIYDNAADIAELVKRVTALEESGSTGSDGYTILSYLESTGVQYIDIGFKPNNNTEISIKFQSSQSNASCGIIAVDDGWTTNGYAIFTGYLEFASSYSAHTLTDGAIHTVEIKKTGKYYKDGSLIWTGTNTTFQARYNITMFCLNRSNVKGDYFIGKIYECQVYDNGILIRDFVPAKNSSGIYGMYDRVYNKFYTNAGTGSFTGG